MYLYFVQYLNRYGAAVVILITFVQFFSFCRRRRRRPLHDFNSVDRGARSLLSGGRGLWTRRVSARGILGEVCVGARNFHLESSVQRRRGSNVLRDAPCIYASYILCSTGCGYILSTNGVFFFSTTHKFEFFPRKI